MRFVEGDVGDVELGGGEVDLGLGGWVVAPGAYGVEVSEEGRGEPGGEGFAVELLGEAVGEVLKHDEADEEGVAGDPGGWGEVEETELEGEMVALDGDGGVDAAGVEVEIVKLVWGEDGDGPVGGGTELEDALGTVVEDEAGAEEFSKLAGGVAAEGFHLPETILRGDVALGEDEVVEGGGADVWDSLGVALDGDGRGEAGDGSGAVKLGQGLAHGVAGPEAGGEEEDGEEQDGEGEADADGTGESGGAGWSVVVWLIHELIADGFAMEQEIWLRGVGGLRGHVLGAV